MGTSCRNSEPINTTQAFTSSRRKLCLQPFQPAPLSRGANCFKTKFNAQANGHNRVNAYLLMMANRLVFADQLGVKLD